METYRLIDNAEAALARAGNSDETNTEEALVLAAIAQAGATIAIAQYLGGVMRAIDSYEPRLYAIAEALQLNLPEMHTE